jgi:hypothetical protein
MAVRESNDPLGAVLSDMAGAGNGPVPALLYVPRLRASFPSTPVESRVGESHTEGSCWRYARKLWMGDFLRHAVYLPKKVVKRSGTPTPVGRILHNAQATSGRGQA